MISITGCESVRHITPELPSYDPVVPERPILMEIDEEVPTEVTKNLVMLVSYAEKLEIVCQGWERFYAGLREIYNDDEYTAR